VAGTRGSGEKVVMSYQNVFRADEHSFVKDIPAQWAKIRQGLDIFRISSKCVCLSNGEV